ncbi:hypothetical protein [Rhizobium sp. PAMB 3182]
MDVYSSQSLTRYTAGAGNTSRGEEDGDAPTFEYGADGPERPASAAQLSDNRPDNIWGTINIGGNVVTIYNGGVTQYENGLTIDIDWDGLNTAEDRANAIMAKYGGSLTMAGTAMSESAYNNHAAQFWAGVLGDENLFSRFFNGTGGGYNEEDQFLDFLADGFNESAGNVQPAE